MKGITKPSITRLARRAGVKSLSDDCFTTTRNLMDAKLNEVVNAILVVNSENGTKTIMIEDLYEALHLLGYNVTRSTEIGTSTRVK